MNCCHGDEGRPGIGALETQKQISIPLGGGEGAAREGWAWRVAGLTRWAVPIATLVLVPKCPACIAAYVVLFTGIGLSTSAAATMRWLLIGVSVGALVYLGAGVVRRRSGMSA